MVTSAPVPAVVGSAMIGTDLFFVGAHPSSETTSANSGLATTMPMPLAVSIDEPPPMAMMQSAPDALNASTPCLTLVTVGLGFISLYMSYANPASSRTSVTIFAVPTFNSPLSVATNAL
ncbi:unknown [Prevotella sp. CAG:1058]|nr:unknown [Prevotella sp. CAG:1058]